MKKNFPELFIKKDVKWSRDIKTLSLVNELGEKVTCLNSLCLGFVVQAKTDFFEKLYDGKNDISLLDLKFAKTANKPCIDISFNKVFACENYASAMRPGRFLRQTLTIIKDEKTRKKYTTLYGIHYSLNYLKKGEKAIFPYVFIENSRLRLFGEAKIDIPEDNFFTYKEILNLTKKLFNDQLIRKKLKEYLSKYGNICEKTKDIENIKLLDW